MKKWKDEDKIRGPMFPRLHVNDTEKGGPRAPPRNKMALYEQLSIPSQRFTNAVSPLNPYSGTGDLVPSSSQGGRSERRVFFSQNLPPRHHSEKQYSQCSDLSTPLTQVELRKELDEDDFRVPIFIQSMPSLECGKFTNDMNTGKLSPSNPLNFNPSFKFKKPEETGLLASSKNLESKSQKEENSKEPVAVQTKAMSSSSFVAKTDSLQKQTDSSLCHETGDNPVNSYERLKSGGSVQPELCEESQPASNMHSTAILGEPVSTIDKSGSSSTLRDLSDDTVSLEDGSRRSLKMVNLERGDSMSETCIVDSICELDITPDDVVGIIGQKHFWKARRAISNQQRAFAGQIFELHRLVNVQRSIATSPHLLLEDTTHITKSIKALPGKKLPLDHSVKVFSNVSKQEGYSEKPCHKEGSAENTVGKSSLSSEHPPSNPKSLSNNASSPPSITSSYNARPWCFNQPHGPQWLIPVMSPSEGLVYKPYPGPGFAGGPPMSNAVANNFLPPAYGVPALHPQYQFPSFPATGTHAYFPPYGTPIMNTGLFSGSSEQTNQPSMPSHFSSGETNFSVHHQNVFDMPSQRQGAVPDAMNSSASDDIEVQTSTASSLSERTQGSAAGNDAMEGRNMLRLFPTSSVTNTPNSSSQLPDPDRRPTRVIKVVPHNAKSATESVARIFETIQEERKQYDSV